MSSTFLKIVKSRISDFKCNLDTLSEPSECGTGSSINSAEELQNIALILGVNNVEDIYQERFRVDRRRLEKMLADNLEESQTAHAFFQRVMNDSNTVIKWPTRLKIGARSKKDPHVRVAGLMENVKLARDKIMQVLDTRSNRVTMRIDVSYTDHSHIIGKSGLTIKRVMDETGCHIHFPDSNRTSTVEKSNQVSIAGDMERVERARARVRALTPLIFSFELPVFTASQPLPDINSIYVLQIQEKYNVQVMLRNRPKLHSNLLVVKGVQWEVEGTMEATTLLMEYMCGPLASQTQVHMNLEISPMHHSVVLGHNSEQLKIIMKGTNTQIMFPDAEDPNIPALRKCSVAITGQIKDVYAARQQLVGSLPLVVIFDMPDECLLIDNENDYDFLNRLMNKYNVFVNIRRKPKQGIASVVIKGIERCAGDIYEARRELLGGKEPVITAEIPETYNIPSISNTMPNYNFNPFSPTQGANLNNSPCTPMNNPFVDLNAFNMANLSPYNPPTPGGYSSPMSPPAFPMWAPSLFPSVQVPNPNIYGKQHPWNPMFNQDEPMMGRPTITVSHYPSRPMEHHRAMPTFCRMFNSSSQASSGYQSNFMGSTNSIDTHNTSSEISAVASPSVSPISKTQSCASSNEVDRSQNDLVNLMTELPISDRRAVGCEKKTLETLNKMSPVSDYRTLKAEADKAMREPVGSGVRVPTTRWSGHFFSQTSPAPLSLQDDNLNATPEKQWNRSTLVRPNVLTESPQKNKQCRYTQLYNLLNELGLSKYIALFQKHEVDLSTFASLSEADLSEIGVMAFGARRKMLLVIEELQKQNSGFKRTPKHGHQGQNQKLIQSPQYNTEALTEQDKW